MQNLDQIRAAAAIELCRREKFYSSDVASIPSLILSNGLLAATAFITEDGKSPREGMAKVMEGVAAHLATPIHGIAVLAKATNAKAMIKVLCAPEATSLDLQRATAEALAFLAFVKRFALKPEKT